MTWLSHFLGLDNAAGVPYLAWSGFGGDIGEAAIVGALVAHYRRMTCHVDHPRFCWRPGVHPVEGTAYRVCRKHHPTVPDRISAEHVAQEWASAGSAAVQEEGS